MEQSDPKHISRGEVQEEKINNIRVHAVVANSNEPEPEKIKGYEMIPNLYANLAIIARRNSGKTSLIYNIVRGVTNNITKNQRASKTSVHIFCSTVMIDPSYYALKSMLRERGIEFEYHTHFIEGSGKGAINHLDAILEGESEDEGDSEEGDPPAQTTQVLPNGDKITYERLEEKVAKIRKRPSNAKIACDKLLIFDDLGADLRHPSIAQLLKVSRHHKMKILIATQTLTDLAPASIKQLDYAIIMKGMDPDKLQSIHTHLDLTDYATFIKFYKYATSERYGFLYVDVRRDKYRKAFNTQLTLPESA